MKKDTIVLGDQRNPLVHLFSQTWKYSTGNQKNVKIFWTMFILANTFELICLPLTMAKIMNMIQQRGVTRDNIYHILILLAFTIVITLVFWSLHGPGRVLEQLNAFKVRSRYKKSLLCGVMNLPLGWHSQHHSGRTIDQIEKGTGALYSFSSHSFQVIYSIVQLAVCYCMLTYYSWPSAIIVSVMVCTTVLITMQFDRRIVKTYKVINKAENSIAERVSDTISKITTVIILRVEKLVFDSISRKIDEPYEMYKKNCIQNEIKWFLTNLCCSSMTCIVLVVYCLQSVSTSKTVLASGIFIMMQYLGKVSELFYKFTEMYGEILQHNTKVLNAEELANDFKPTSFTNHVLPKNWQQISINGLNFSYHTEGDPVERDMHLDDLSITIGHGEHIALVGESGSGKTTFLKIMRGLYDPSSLVLSVDGAMVADGFNGIKRDITLVPQEPEIYATTIRENITLGIEYEGHVIDRAVKMAMFSEVADQLPNKLDSKVHEKGVNLSGGQQQRLALARGFLACIGKSVIMLDEPTSNVDAGNEAQIYENIKREH